MCMCVCAYVCAGAYAGIRGGTVGEAIVPQLISDLYMVHAFVCVHACLCMFVYAHVCV